jgi:hypothetical protein
MAAARGANDPMTPVSWNRFAYVQGDPVNANDRKGLYLMNGADESDLWGYEGGPLGDGCAEIDPSTGYFFNCGVGGPNNPEINAPAPSPPKCNNKSVDSQFLAANYGAAAVLSTQTNVPLDWILSWAASESGSKTTAGWGQSGAAINSQNYFGQRSTNWPGAIPCTGNYVPGWACFSGFFASAKSALETVHANWTFNGTNKVTAAQILTSFGNNIAAAFQAVAAAGQDEPNDPNYGIYGAKVAAVPPGVDARLNCLGLIVF